MRCLIGALALAMVLTAFVCAEPLETEGTVARRTPSKSVTVTNGKGIPKLVFLGEKKSRVTKRLGKPRGKGSTSARGLLWYKSRGLVIDAEFGRVQKIWATSRRYQTEKGVGVGDTFATVYQRYPSAQPYVYASDGGALPSHLTGLRVEGVNIEFFSDEVELDANGQLPTAQRAKKIKFIVWGQ